MQSRVGAWSVWLSIRDGIEEAQLKLEELKVYANENGAEELEQCIDMLRNIWEVVNDYTAAAPEQVTSRNSRE